MGSLKLNFGTLLVLFLSIQVGAVSFDDALRDDTGKPMTTTFYKAMEYCGEKGSRLPSAREYAEFAMSHGAKGIRENSFSNLPYRIGLQNELLPEYQRVVSDGYHPIFNDKVPMLYGGLIDFYYNSAGYKLQINEPDMEFIGFWTSTVGLANAQAEPYVFRPSTGEFGVDFAWAKSSGVKCIKK